MGDRHFSLLEHTVLAYVLSYALTAFLAYLFGLLLRSSNWIILTDLTYIVIGSVALMKSIKESSNSLVRRRDSFSSCWDPIFLMLLGVFFFVAAGYLYPIFSTAEIDSLDHFWQSQVWIRSPKFYTGWAYAWFHFFSGTFCKMSGATIYEYKTSLVTLGFTFVLAFYIMAKEYLSKINKSLPIIATILFALSSGLAWVYVAWLRLNVPEISEKDIHFGLAYEKTYGGTTGNFGLQFVQYTPIVASLTFLLVLIYLMARSDLPRVKAICLFSIAFAASYLSHVAEAIFVVLLSALYVFTSEDDHIRKIILVAILIGLGASGLIWTSLPLVTAIRFSPWVAGYFFIPATILIVAYVLGKFSKKLMLKVNVRMATLAPVVLFSLLLLYSLSLHAWYYALPTFSLNEVATIGSVPWFFYPFIIGITGILAIVGIYYFLFERKTYNRITIFIFMALLAVGLGRFTTLVALSSFAGTPGIGWLSLYWEKRYLVLLFIACSVLASVGIFKMATFMKKGFPTDELLHTLAISATLGLLMVASISSTLIGVEAFAQWADNFSFLDPNLQQAVSFLNKVFNENNRTALLASPQGYTLAKLAAPPYLYPLSTYHVISHTESAALTFYALLPYDSLSNYLLVLGDDSNNLQNSYLGKQILPNLLPSFRNFEVTIYNLPYMSFPITSSNTTLVIPFDSSLDPQEPWLYAYDICAQGRLNYTIAYDLDPQALNSNIVILSIDPPEQNIIHRSFQDNFLSQGQWSAISGMWRYTDEGLVGGKTGEYTDGIMLSPILAQNFTASLIVKMIDADLNVSNYVSLIYGWKDYQNFIYSGMHFDRDGSVYVYFAQVKNGQITNYPEWPGLKTDLKRSFGRSFNLTVSVQGTKNELFVNGRKYLSMNLESEDGQIGIRYTRFYQVIFNHFNVKSSIRVKLREFDDYINYVKNGGYLIVLNTNGYGSFSQLIFKPLNSCMKADAIETIYGERFSLIANVTKLILNSSEFRPLASYVSSSGENTVYAVEGNVGSGKLVYANVYPLIKETSQHSWSKPSIYQIQGKLLSILNLSLGNFKYARRLPSAIFKQVDVSGNIEVNTSSVIFPLKVNIDRVDVEMQGGSASFDNISRIEISKYKSVTVTGEKLLVTDGNEFYPVLTFNETVHINLTGDNTMLRLTSNNQEYTLTNVLGIKIKSENIIEIYAREPLIKAYGDISFKELYASGEMFGAQNLYGQDLVVKGEVLMEIYISDVYTLVNNLSVKGLFQRNPPLIIYDESSSLLQSVLLCIFLLPVFVAFFLFLRQRKTQCS
jgi:hypothetical protein